MRERAILQKIENDREIQKETDREFLFAFQRALLLALKEAEFLNELQYRYAAEQLRQQYHASLPENQIKRGDVNR